MIAEKNQGGEMVKQTLPAAGVSFAIELVHAGRSKRTRAEPVYAAYEQGRVTHCGTFEALEQQLMAIGATEDDDGLDRADALVWALLTLLPLPLPKLGRPHIWRA